MQPVPFVRKARPGRQASLRLFCFPFAGGSELLFRTWPDRMPPTIEACPVCLPGRGARFGEPPVNQLLPLVESVANALTPYLDMPYALFGYSMGALLSFELARLLQRRGAPAPVHLFVAAQRAPQIPLDIPPVDELPDAEFLEEMQQMGGTPQEVFANAELMQMMVPLLRADFAACRTYRYEPGEPLYCPVTAMGGLDDLGLAPTDLRAWKQQTTGAFTATLFPGDHFFLRTEEQTMIQKIVNQLALAGPSGVRH